LEKISFPSTVTSNTPPLDLIKSGAIPNFFSKTFAKLAAVGL
jgi:hypothetical protein